MTEQLPARRWLRGSSETVRPDLAYVDTGAHGTPVLLQHGLCGNAEQTWELFPRTSAARFLVLECRGHGCSPSGPTQDLSIASFAADVESFMATVSDAPAVVGGVSMGAAIALRLAVKAPERVRALVLIRPAWLYQAAPENMKPNLEVGRLLAQLPPGAARDVFLKSATAERLREGAPDNLQSLSTFFAREPVQVTAALLERISLDGPGVTRGEVRTLSVPTLVIGHAADAIHPLELARSLANDIPGATFVEVTPKAVEREAYVYDIRRSIERFLQGLEH